MKIQPNHYHILKEAIEIVIKDNPTAKDDYEKEGLTPKRYRWDLLYTSMVRIHDKNTVPTINHKYCLPLYDYLNDNHIDTALRNIVKNY